MITFLKAKAKVDQFILLSNMAVAATATDVLQTIIEFFTREASQIGITQDTLNNPMAHVDALIRAYNFMCDLILQDMVMEGSDIHNDTDLLARPKIIFQTKTRLNMIYNAIRKGNDEIRLTDLVQPDPKRTRGFLYQMIRFYKFKCSISNQIVNVDEQIEDQRRTYGFEKELLKKSEEKFGQAKQQLASLNTKKQDLQKQEFELSQKLTTKKAEVEMKKEKWINLQERRNELNAKIEHYNKKFGELEETCRRLDMNIVNSPDRLLGELQQLKTQKAEAQQKLEQAQHEFRDMERELSELTVMDNAAAAMLEERKKLEIELHKMAKLRETENKFAQEINELELRKNNLLLELDQSKKAAQTELDNLKREMSSSHKEITGILRQKEQIERDEKEVAGRLVQVKENIRQHQQKIKRKERCFAIAQEDYDEAVKKMLSSYKLLQTKMEEQEASLDMLVAKAAAAIEPEKQKDQKSQDGSRNSK